MDIKVMGMLLFILCTIFDSMFAFNHTSAEAECTEDGGLASYRHFVGEEGSDLDKTYDLKEGESAWIAGYVNFSQLVAYQACASKVNNSVLNYTLQDESIYNCLQKCTEIANILYIGLHNNFCYCAKREELNYFELQPDNYCNPELINSNFIPQTYVSSIKANISLYSIISNTRVTWDQPFSEARGQCVKVRSDGRDMKYETDSCYSKANSFICKNSAIHRSLIGNCGLQQLSFCLISGSNSWMTSFKQCIKYQGKLNHFIYSTMKTFMTANEFYWTGIFRTFKIGNKTGVPHKNDVCLSVKNASGKLVLDPSDCSAGKEKNICEGNFTKKHRFTSIKTNVDSKNNSVSVGSLTAESVVENTTMASATKLISLKHMSTAQTNIEDDNLDLTGVYIAGCVVFAVALIIIIACIVMRKRKQLKTTSTQNIRYSKDLGNNITDNTIKGSIPDDVALKQELAQSVEDEYTYATPDYTKKHNPSPESEYDRIRIKGPSERKEKSAKAKTIDDHVYGIHSAHPIDSEIEVYDHLEAARKTNVSKPTDGIYNTLAEDSDTYNVLGHGNKEESSKSAVNQKQIKETCPTYDKLKRL